MNLELLNKQIKDEGAGLKIFKELTDFSIPKEEAMSRVSWKFVDCKNFKLKEIITGFYSLKGGTGKQLDNYYTDADTKDSWFDVSLPNTVGNLIAEKVPKAATPITLNNPAIPSNKP